MPALARFLKRLFGDSPSREAAMRHYVAAVGAARHPFFYERLAVPDTVDGRFDLVVLHVWLLMERLRTIGEMCRPMQMMLQEALFADMDRSLREMGVGDLSVGRHVRDMASAWFGRLGAYDAAHVSDDPSALAEALVRNLWRGTAPDAGAVETMVDYVRRQHRHLAAQDDQALCGGHVDFLAPDDAGTEAETIDD